jgi:hypothetical protein
MPTTPEWEREEAKINAAVSLASPIFGCYTRWYRLASPWRLVTCPAWAPASHGWVGNWTRRVTLLPACTTGGFIRSADFAQGQRDERAQPGGRGASAHTFNVVRSHLLEYAVRSRGKRGPEDAGIWGRAGRSCSVRTAERLSPCWTR